MDYESGCGCFTIAAIVISIIGILLLAAKNDNDAIQKAKRNLHDDQYLYLDKYILNKADTKVLNKDHYEIKFSGNSVTDNSSSGFDDKATCQKVMDRYIKQFKNRSDYNYKTEIKDDSTVTLMPISTGSTTTFINQYNDSYYGRLLMDKK